MISGLTNRMMMDGVEPSMDAWVLDPELEVQFGAGSNIDFEIDLFPDTNHEDTKETPPSGSSANIAYPSCNSLPVPLTEIERPDIGRFNSVNNLDLLYSTVTMSPVSNPTSPGNISRRTSTTSRPDTIESEPLAIIDDIFTKTSSKKADELSQVLEQADSIDEEDILEQILAESNKIDWDSQKYSQVLKELEAIHDLACNDCAEESEHQSCQSDQDDRDTDSNHSTHNETNETNNQDLLQPTDKVQAKDVQNSIIYTPIATSTSNMAASQIYTVVQVIPASPSNTDPEWLPDMERKESARSGRKRKRESDSDVEGEKYQVKRDQNKEAARRYRDKKKNEAVAIGMELDAVSATHSDLKKVLKKRDAERRIMIELWTELAKSATNPDFSVEFPDWVLHDENA